MSALLVDTLREQLGLAYTAHEGFEGLKTLDPARAKISMLLQAYGSGCAKVRLMGFTSLLILAVAGALASPIGGALALWKRPTTLGLSIAVGFAAGALLGAFAFEMLPNAVEVASL